MSMPNSPSNIKTIPASPMTKFVKKSKKEVIKDLIHENVKSKIISNKNSQSNTNRQTFLEPNDLLVRI